LDSVAQALAKNVLPVPGGPYKRIPFQGFLVPLNNSGNLIGKITASYNDDFACFKPATSSHYTFSSSLDTIYSFNYCSNLFRPSSSLPLPLPSFCFFYGELLFYYLFWFYLFYCEG